MIQVPEVVGLIVCDKLEVNPVEGKVSIAGVVQSFRFSLFPTSPNDFTVYAALSGGAGEGALRLAITRLETDKVIYYKERWVSFPEDKLLVINQEIRIRQFVFEAPGRFALTLFFDKKFVTERALPVYAESQS